MKRPIIDVTSSMIDPSRSWSSRGVNMSAMPPPDLPNPAAAEDAIENYFDNAPIIRVAANGSIFFAMRRPYWP